MLGPAPRPQVRAPALPPPSLPNQDLQDWGEETVDIWKTDNDSENLIKEEKIEIKKEEDEENNSSLFETKNLKLRILPIV